ncbi:MAG: hypothetical protein WD048_16720 [Chitinophagales bacterium]
MMLVTKPDNSIETIELKNVFYDKPETLALNTIRIKEELAKWYDLGYKIEAVIGENIGRSTMILRKE